MTLCLITFTVTQNAPPSTLRLALSNGSGVAFEEQIVDQLPAVAGLLVTIAPIPALRHLRAD